jgi:hypothetical protein
MFNFNLWVSDREQIDYIKLFAEALDSRSAQAADVNREITNLLSRFFRQPVENNWYGMAVQAASKFLPGRGPMKSQGQDADALARLIIEDIYYTLMKQKNDPGDRLYQALAEIRDKDLLPAELKKELGSQFNVACYMRARRFAVSKEMSNTRADRDQVVSMGQANQKELDDASQERVNPISSLEDEEHFNVLKDMVIKELDLMGQETAARDVRLKGVQKRGPKDTKRIEMAKLVASVRLNDPMTPMSLRDLAKYFDGSSPDRPKISLGSMKAYTDLIHDAFINAAKRHGYRDLENAGRDIRNKISDKKKAV